MPNQSDPKSPFEIVTPPKSKRTGNKGLVVATLIVVFLILSVVAGVLLVKQKQNISQKAAAEMCPAAEACPVSGQPNLLRSCHPPESNGETTNSLCNIAGRTELCGTQTFCCPGPNQAWTTDMTACPACNITGATNLAARNITGTSATLTWTPGTGGRYVKMWVSTSTDALTGCNGVPANTTNTTCVVNESADGALASSPGSYNVTNLTPNTTYYWKFMMWDASGCDAGSAVVTFTTTSDSETPTPTPVGSPTPTATATPTATTAATATPTGTATGTPKATATASPTPTASATPAPTTASATAMPIPVTGTDWPTVAAAALGIGVIIASILIAL